MVYFVITVVFLSLFLTAMAIGVIFGREPLKGSCGGLGKIMSGGKCEFCGESGKCEKRRKEEEAAKA